MEPRALLKTVSETYRDLKRYHFEAQSITETKTKGPQGESERWSKESVIIAAIKPDRLRIETKNPTLNVTLVSDGQTRWVCAPKFKQYTRRAAGAAGDSRESSGAAGFDLLLGRAALRLMEYERLTEWLREAKSLPDEAVEVSGQKINCSVVEVEYGSPASAMTVLSSRKTFWIDQVRHIILREIATSQARSPAGITLDTKQTITFTTAKVDEPIPETLFAFTPPEGAREMAELSIPGITQPRPRVELTGTAAADFTLADLEGKQLNLRSLRGKVVLLDFWASWCGPCRVELPHIEKLHREFKDQDLVVLGINDEEPEIAREFLKKKGYTFTSLVDDQREVAQGYQVHGIPQVFVIGKDGQVVSHSLGAKSEHDLRAALQKAGINAAMAPLPSSSANPESTAARSTSRPTILSRPRAEYTEKARRNQVNGVVVLRALFTADGKVTEIEVIRGLPDGLTEKAIEAARKIRFNPAIKDGVAVSVRLSVEYSFSTY